MKPPHRRHLARWPTTGSRSQDRTVSRPHDHEDQIDRDGHTSAAPTCSQGHATAEAPRISKVRPYSSSGTKPPQEQWAMRSAAVEQLHADAVLQCPGTTGHSVTTPNKLVQQAGAAWRYREGGAGGPGPDLEWPQVRAETVPSNVPQGNHKARSNTYRWGQYTHHRPPQLPLNPRPGSRCSQGTPPVRHKQPKQHLQRRLLDGRPAISFSNPRPFPVSAQCLHQTVRPLWFCCVPGSTPPAYPVNHAASHPKHAAQTLRLSYRGDKRQL